jgi:hypothetical protein
VNIIVALAAVVIPVVAGFLAKEIALANGYISQESPLVQSVVAFVVGLALSFVGSKLGLNLPGSLAGLDTNVVASILTALVALLTHTSSVAALKRSR